MNRAAMELHTVQSNVTARIRALETELGVALFDRHARGVSLTPAGLRLLPYAVKVRSLLHDAARAARDQGTPSGALTIGALESTAALRLSPLLARYAAAWPDVDLSLRTGTTCELIDDVLARRVDGAFVCGPVDHADLEAQTMFQEELAILTAPGTRNLDAAIRRPGFRVIVLRAGCSYRLRLEAWLAQRGIVGVRMLEFGTLEAILACVGAGLGVTMLPRGLAESAERAGTVAVQALPPAEARVETVFVRRRDSHNTSALAAFLAAATDGFTQRMAAE